MEQKEDTPAPLLRLLSCRLEWEQDALQKLQTQQCSSLFQGEAPQDEHRHFRIKPPNEEWKEQELNHYHTVLQCGTQVQLGQPQMSVLVLTLDLPLDGLSTSLWSALLATLQCNCKTTLQPGLDHHESNTKDS